MNPSATCRRACALATLAAVAFGAQAAEWSVEPRLNLRGLYGTNPRMQTKRYDGSVAAVLDTGAQMGVATESGKFSFLPRGRFTRYEAYEILKSDDLFINVAGERDWERLRAGFSVDYSLESTTTSEVLISDVGDLRFEETSKRVNTWYLAPYLIWQASDRDNLQLNLGHTDTSYEQGLFSNLLDYKYKLANLTYARQLCEADRLTATVFHTRYIVPDNELVAKSYAVLGGYEHAFGPTFKANASLGRIVTVSDFVELGQPQDTVVRGFLIDAGAEKKLFATTTLKAKFSRNVFPSSRGAQSTRDEYSASVEHNFSDRWWGSVNWRNLTSQTQQQESTPNAATSDLNRETTSIYAGMGYRLTRFWSLSGSYSYTEQQYTGDSDKSRGHALNLTLNYGGDRVAVSH